MKLPATLLALLLAVFLAGCDGHGRVLYLHPATAMQPPHRVASVVIPIDGREDVAAIVAKVAADLGMAADPKDRNHWSLALAGTNSFQLSARKEAGGYWTVALLDWPSLQRSPQSRQAEAAIRGALGGPHPVSP